MLKVLPVSNKTSVKLISLQLIYREPALAELRTLLSGGTDFALDPAIFQEAVERDLKAGLLPFFLNANVGTTSTCAVDPLDRLGVITQQHDIW